jgi:type III pantothenate kinase
MNASVVLISVGNTRTRFAPVAGEQLEPSRVLANDDAGAIADAVAKLGKSAVIASVNDPVADGVEKALVGAGVKVHRFGREVAIPIVHTLDDGGAKSVGQDRLLDALGAFARSGQACVVIDAGTAVTVDFVDGEGVFHGGAIAPGVRMMLRALHEQTRALPLVEMSRELLPAPVEPGDEDDTDLKTVIPFGKNTKTAIAIGVASAVRGMAHELIDTYAAFYGAYPRVVATGGDAPLLFEGDPLIEAIVPDLVLVGMLEAVKQLDA